MPNPTIRLGPWSGAGRDEFTLELDLGSITTKRASEGCVLRLPFKVQPDEVGWGRSLLAVHGRLTLVENITETAGVAIPMQTWYPNYSYVDAPLSFTDMARADLARQGGDVNCVLSLSALANVQHKPLPNQQVPA